MTSEQRGLEQTVKHAVHFTSGDGYERQNIPADLLGNNKTYETTIEPSQIPFLLAPNLIRGTSELGTNEHGPFRRIVITKSSLTDTRGYKALGSKKEPIPVYNRLEDALFELAPRVLPFQRENTKQLLHGLSDETCVLQFAGGHYGGTLSFLEGNLVAAVTRTGHEELRGKEGTIAFLLLSSYQPLRFTPAAFDENSADYIGAGINALPAAALPAFAHVLREGLEKRAFGNHLFNVTEQDGRCVRAGSPDYAVGLELDGAKVGILRVRNGEFIDGKVRGQDSYVFGDDALRLALDAAHKIPEIAFVRLEDKEALDRPMQGNGRARQTALATTAQYLARQHL